MGHRVRSGGVLENSAELLSFSELREEQKTKELHKPAADSRPDCRFIVLLGPEKLWKNGQDH